ncbi:MAG: hypothetical protein JST93_12815 [Acidobacteria bacterium]|nr:hypothetical protein [Acidobacteriota bacterium]
MLAPRKLGFTQQTTSSGASAIVTLTTLDHHIAPNAIFVCVAADANRSITGITDTAGNAYAHNGTISNGTSATDPKCSIWSSPGTSGLNASGSILVTTNGLGVGGTEVFAYAGSGLTNTFDSSGSALGPSGEPSIGITTVAASTMILALLCQEVGIVSVGYEEDSDYTSLDPQYLRTADAIVGGTAFRIVTNPLTDTWAPTTNYNVKWCGILMSFTGEPTSNPASPSTRRIQALPLLGAG